MSRPIHKYGMHACYRLAGGFTYLGVLIIISIIGIASVASLQAGILLQRRAAEEDLLFIGMQFRNALVSYANATPVGQPRFPKSLNDLLLDPRSPTVRRHLRKRYADPMTGQEQWGTVEAPGSAGIIGIYSLSTATPIKVASFDAALQGLEGKTSYQEWKFMLPEAMQRERR